MRVVPVSKPLPKVGRKMRLTTLINPERFADWQTVAKTGVISGYARVVGHPTLVFFAYGSHGNMATVIGYKEIKARA